MSFFNFLMGPFAQIVESNSSAFEAKGLDRLKNIVLVLDNLIIPITIFAVILGSGWVIWYGVKLAKSEDAKGAKEAKSALIRVSLTIIVTLAVIWILIFIASQLPSWLGSSPIDPPSNPSKPTPHPGGDIYPEQLGHIKILNFF